MGEASHPGPPKLRGVALHPGPAALRRSARLQAQEVMSTTVDSQSVLDALEFDFTIADSESESGGEVEELPVAHALPRAISPLIVPVRAPVWANPEECVVAQSVIAQRSDQFQAEGCLCSGIPPRVSRGATLQSERCPYASGRCHQVRHCRAQ